MKIIFGQKYSVLSILLLLLVVTTIVGAYFLGKGSFYTTSSTTYPCNANEKCTLIVLTNKGMVDWSALLSGIFGPLVVGIVIWGLGVRESDNKIKQDAIRDLMTYRGDYASVEFTRSLNRTAIIFHDDSEIRNDIRKLYDVINNPSSQNETTVRAIVGLIYKLCHKNNFQGLTEYDIDQSFVKASQIPSASTSPSVSVHSQSQLREERMTLVSRVKKRIPLNKTKK